MTIETAWSTTLLVPLRTGSSNQVLVEHGIYHAVHDLACEPSAAGSATVRCLPSERRRPEGRRGDGRGA